MPATYSDLTADLTPFRVEYTTRRPVSARTPRHVAVRFAADGRAALASAVHMVRDEGDGSGAVLGVRPLTSAEWDAVREGRGSEVL